MSGVGGGAAARSPVHLWMLGRAQTGGSWCVACWNPSELDFASCNLALVQEPGGAAAQQQPDQAAGRWMAHRTLVELGMLVWSARALGCSAAAVGAQRPYSSPACTNSSKASPHTKRGKHGAAGVKLLCCGHGGRRRFVGRTHRGRAFAGLTGSEAALACAPRPASRHGFAGDRWMPRPTRCAGRACRRGGQHGQRRPHARQWRRLPPSPPAPKRSAARRGARHRAP
jgi:hypothetical protein